MSEARERFYREIEAERCPRTDALAERVERRPPARLLSTYEEMREHARQLERALNAILAEPHGCPFCDSGKLRNPTKAHDPRCGYALAAELSA